MCACVYVFVWERNDKSGGVTVMSTGTSVGRGRAQQSAESVRQQWEGGRGALVSMIGLSFEVFAMEGRDECGCEDEDTRV